MADSEVYRKKDVPADSDKIGAFYDAAGKYNQKVVLTDDEGAEHLQVPVASAGWHSNHLTPTLSTLVYAAGDVLFPCIQLPSVMLANGGSAALHYISIIDKGDIKGAFDIVVMRQTETIGAANEVLSMDDTEAGSVLAVIPVVAGDYIDLGAQAWVQKPNLGMACKSANDSKNLYFFGISRDTKTYAATDLMLYFYFMRDTGVT